MAGNSKVADDYSSTRVPKEATLKMWPILFTRIGGFTALTQFLLGATLGYSMSFWHAVLAILLGSVLLEGLFLVIGFISIRERLSTTMLTRWTGFGRYGSSIIGLIVAVSLIGWFGVQNAVFADALKRAFGMGFPLAAFISGMFVTFIVIFGIKWLNATAIITVPPFFLMIGYGIYHVLKQHSISELIASPPPGPAISIGTAATIVAGGVIVGVVIAPDTLRFVRTKRDILWITLIPILVGEFGIGLIAVLMSHAVKSSNVLDIMLSTAGVFATAIVILGTVKINDINLYSASLGFSNLIHSLFQRKLNRGMVTLGIGVLGTILSMVGILDKFVGFLTFLGVWIPPICGIIIIDYYFIKRNRKILDESREEGTLPATSENINFVTIVAWILGFAAGYFIKFGVPSLNSLLVSALVYYVGSKYFIKSYNPIIADSNKDIV